MSKIRYELEHLISRLSSEANKMKDPDVKSKYYFLKKVAGSTKPLQQACEERGRSRSYFYKWAERLIAAESLEGLRERSRAPKRKHNETAPKIVRKIKLLRKKEPFAGPERIAHKLRSKHKMACPKSTVYDILVRENLIDKVYNKRATKKHLKRYRRPLPGYLQLDIKYVPYLIEGKQMYQFSCVDHHSSFRVIDVYRDRTLTSVISFMERVIMEVPFPILQLQTDNAVEFTDKYSSGMGAAPTGAHELDRWCMMRDIEHKLIPIGEKELNGKVENTHRFDDREFYSQHDPQTYEELRLLIQAYNRRWNVERETKTLGWRAPEQVVYQAYIKAYAFVSYLKELYPEPEAPTIYRKVTEGGALIESQKPDPRPPKKKTYIDRYLEYSDWVEKKVS